MGKEYNHNSLVQFDIIVKSTKGDIEAINKVLNHFSGYIAEV